jgi:phosphoribosylamine--glycine ligase
VKVILLGSGAREHALARSLAHDPAVSTVIALPGNPGIATLARCLPGDPADPELVVEIATAEQVDLVVVGPEAPLVAGVADAVRAAGIPCFGPSAEAARIEGSKAFAKEIMAAAGVPTAAAHVCTTLDAVEAALTATGAPFVVKEDGLAAGKGVVVCTAREEALAHAAACLGREDGRVVVEDFLDGPEVSLFCLSDGRTVVPLEPAQDFKRVGDDDTGANTGGMGAYTPLPWTPEGLVQDVVRTVAEPTVRTLAERGMPFVGLLYIGLALTPVGPRVIEYNARFGDPETQAVLARLQTPLAGVLLAAAEGRLAELPPLEWSPESAVTVVVAAEGYPAGPLTGDPVSGLEDAESVDGVHVLQAGTRVEEPGDVAADAEPSATDGNAGRLVSAGGRVLSVVALGEDLTQARERAYGAVSRISLRGSHHRSDIAARAAAGQVLVPVIPGLLDADEPTRSPSQEP